jgi:hypothetical protein
MSPISQAQENLSKKRTTADSIRELIDAMPIVIFARAIRAAFGRTQAAKPAASSRAAHAAR